MTVDRQREQNDGQLRISLTLPGSASLGAFQAGAIAALDVVLRTIAEHGHRLRVDALGGSSAGSIIAMLYAHCLTTGRDVGSLLHEAWVEDVNVSLLSDGGPRAPLGFDQLEQKMRDFLDDRDEHPYGVHPSAAHPIQLHVGLTVLQGFTRELSTLDTREISLDYADAVAFTIEPADDADGVLEPNGQSVLDAVLASATHPGAFAPRLLDRSNDREALQEAGVTNLPPAGKLWYTDGGLVESRPIGRVLEGAQQHRSIAADDRRLHLVVDPRSSGASGHERWSDPDDPADWVDGLRRALAILPTQALHDDLRRVSAINERVRAIDELCDRLVDADESLDRSELGRELHEAAGTLGKTPVAIEMISPLVLVQSGESGDRGVGDLLAGDFIGAFGGFLNRHARRSDFRLGWHSTRTWTRERMTEHGVPDEIVEAALENLDEESSKKWPEMDTGDDGMEQLSARDRVQLARLALRAGAHLVRSALPTPKMPWTDAEPTRDSTSKNDE